MDWCVRRVRLNEWVYARVRVCIVFLSRYGRFFLFLFFLLLRLLIFFMRSSLVHCYCFKYFISVENHASISAKCNIKVFFNRKHQPHKHTHALHRICTTINIICKKKDSLHFVSTNLSVLLTHIVCGACVEPVDVRVSNWFR